MKSPALVSVVGEAEVFAPLFAAAAGRSLRVGWLDLDADVPVPEPLAGAAQAGAAKAVAITPAGAVSWKRRRGAPVLRDLLREQFVGYAVVLVRGGESLPRLFPADGRFRLEAAGGSRLLDADGLLSELLRPRYRR